jgi:hypothetical protein
MLTKEQVMRLVRAYDDMPDDTCVDITVRPQTMEEWVVIGQAFKEMKVGYEVSFLTTGQMLLRHYGSIRWFAITFIHPQTGT